MFTKLINWLLGKGSSLLKFLQPVLVSEAGSLLTKLLPIAKDVVIEVAKTGDLPNVKRDAAFTKVKDAATNAGIEVGNSLINAAIELAYQHVAATQPDALK